MFERRVYIENDKDHPALYEGIHSVDPFVPTAVGLPQSKQNKTNKHSIGESGRIWFLFLLLSIGKKQLTI